MQRFQGVAALRVINALQQELEEKGKEIAKLMQDLEQYMRAANAEAEYADELRDERDEARKDVKRLDWLETNADMSSTPLRMYVSFPYPPECCRDVNSVREAINVAKREKK